MAFVTVDTSYRGYERRNTMNAKAKLAWALILLPMLATTGAAQSTEEEGNVANWLVSCNNQQNQDALSCSISQNIVNRQSNQRIALLQVGRSDGDDVLEVHVPFGVDISKGLRVSVDGTDIARVLYTTANATGLMARIPMSKQVLGAMTAGRLGTLYVQNVQGQPLEIQVKLSGFTKAYGLYSRVMK